MFQKLLQSEKHLLIWIQNRLRRSWLTILMKTATLLGNGGILWLFTAMCLLFRPRRRFAGAALLLSLLLSIICINLLLKNIVARKRPHDKIESLRILIRRPEDFSFPSGHTSSSFAAAVVLLYTTPNWLGIAALTIAILIAFSRLYLGAHFPSDVLCGALLGIMIGMISVPLLRFLLKCSWIPTAVIEWFPER